MPKPFFVPRNLLKALQVEPQQSTMDLTVDDKVHFNTPGFERARIKTLRDLVSQTLAWDEHAKQQLGAEIDRLDREVADAQRELQATEPQTGTDQILLEQTIEACQWMAEGLAQMRLFLEVDGPERLEEGMGLVERAVRRVDELLSPSTLEFGRPSEGIDYRR